MCVHAGACVCVCVCGGVHQTTAAGQRSRCFCGLSLLECLSLCVKVFRVVSDNSHPSILSCLSTVPENRMITVENVRSC